MQMSFSASTATPGKLGCKAGGHDLDRQLGSKPEIALVLL